MNGGFSRPRRGRGAVRVDLRPLRVHDVGSFEASFVPRIEDFERLGPRFQIPASIWSQVPEYSDYGFSVFKLKAGARKVHPTAFEFETRVAERLFFPTFHIHDGAIEPKADFDHTLFCQARDVPQDWPGTTTAPARHFVDLEKCAGLVDGADVVYRRVFLGPAQNTDIWHDA